MLEYLTGCGERELALSSYLSIGGQMGPGCVLQRHCFLRYFKKIRALSQVFTEEEDYFELSLTNGMSWYWKGGVQEYFQYTVSALLVHLSSA